MKIDRICLWDIQIPFKLKVEHGAASRLFSDSIIVLIESRGHYGFGEIIIRDYVSGGLDSGEQRLTVVQNHIDQLISPLRNSHFDHDELIKFFISIACKRNELPLVCGIETALHDLICRKERLDIYQLLKLEPQKSIIRYGAILPILPLEMSRNLLRQCAHLGLKNIRVKLGSDLSYNHEVLQLCRQILGPEYPIRIDANCSWTPKDIEKQLEICRRFSVETIEQPMQPERDESRSLLKNTQKNGMAFMADESILTFEDLQKITSHQKYQFVNLRLSKNGGLIRLLKIAEEATAAGIGIQVGCHVGETGILSAYGRVAASLIPQAVYVDGSYDDYLLSENITTENFSFGHGGTASIKRGNGIGFQVDRKKLDKLSVDYLEW